MQRRTHYTVAFVISTILFVIGLLDSPRVLTPFPLGVSDETGGAIAGTVRSKGGAPIKGAAVRLIGTSRGATSKADGSFFITEVEPGSYVVIAASVGYYQDSVHLDVKAGEKATATISLRPLPGVTGQITARALNTPRSRSGNSLRASATIRTTSHDCVVYSVTTFVRSGIGRMVGVKAGSTGGYSHRSGVGGMSIRINEIPATDPYLTSFGNIYDMFTRSEYPTTYGSAVNTAPTQKPDAGAAAKQAAPPPPPKSEPEPAPAPEPIVENEFIPTMHEPTSTFGIDVDNASYTLMRQLVTGGQLPPASSVRIEEMLNYFTYDYPEPTGPDPFSVVTEVSSCPWNMEHRLVHIGLQGRHIDLDALPPSNLVFLIDVSGSMAASNKLPLLVDGLKLMVNRLRPEDRVAIVVYAGAAGEVLPSTPGSQREKIIAALDSLKAEGSTAGGEGIKLAYQIARKSFMRDGNNRVILATDGDFNVGITDDDALVKLIESRRKDGIFLTVLGFGMRNYRDAKMEKLADNGNGTYAYIDNIREAERTLVSELSGTLYTIAKDVKLQVEFNPITVAGYRLIGYEDRILANEDFANDMKDAGDLGAGHSVTALYEIIPARRAKEEAPQLSDATMRYQLRKINPEAYMSNELMDIRLRYKLPADSVSRLIEHPITDMIRDIRSASESFRFAAAVAELGMLLRDSKYKGSTTYDTMLELARGSRGTDPGGYRYELITLAERCRELAGK